QEGDVRARGARRGKARRQAPAGRLTRLLVPEAAARRALRGGARGHLARRRGEQGDRKSTRLNSSHSQISYAVFCLKKKTKVPVALPASVQADAERHSVHLLDVSSGGAKLKCSIGLSVGTTVPLDCGKLARSAVIRW